MLLDLMQGTTFETGNKAAAGAVSQTIPVYTGEDFEVVSTLRLWGDNTYGQLGMGSTGGSVSGDNPVIIDNVVGLSIGNGSIYIIKKE